MREDDLRAALGSYTDPGLRPPDPAGLRSRADRRRGRTVGEGDAEAEGLGRAESTGTRAVLGRGLVSDAAAAPPPTTTTRARAAAPSRCPRRRSARDRRPAGSGGLRPGSV